MHLYHEARNFYLNQCDDFGARGFCVSMRPNEVGLNKMLTVRNSPAHETIQNSTLLSLDVQRA